MYYILFISDVKMDSLRASMDFDSLMDCHSIAASTEEILWSDDDTIVPEQEQIWHNGEKVF